MSRGRYWAGSIFGVAAAIAVAFWGFSDGGGELFSVLLLSYLVLSLVSQLIWWRGLGIRVLLIVAGVGWIPAGFSLNMLGSGSGLGLIIGLLIIGPCFSFLGGCLALGIMICVVLSMISYPFLLFSIRGETY